MQQLTLQFDGYADEIRQPETQATTKQCTMDIVELMTLIKSISALKKVSYFFKSLVQATLCVAFGLSLMFIAALIG